MSNFKTTTKRTKRAIEVKWIKKDDALVPKIMSFLRQYFHPNEPLNRSIDLMSNQNNIETLDVLYASCFSYNASAVAIDIANGELVGVLLNTIQKKNDIDETANDPRWKPSPVYEKFLDLIVTIEHELNLFGKYPNVEKIFNHAILSVSDQWQGDGISQILVNYSNNVIAPQLNCKLSFVICSSYFSAIIFAKCGYLEVFSKKFRDYKGDDGKVLFPTEEPHEYITGKLLVLGELNNN